MALPAGSRRLSFVTWIVLVVIYLAIIQGLGHVLSQGLPQNCAAPTTVNEAPRPAALVVGGLVKGIGETSAVDGVDLSVPTGWL